MDHVRGLTCGSDEKILQVLAATGWIATRQRTERLRPAITRYRVGVLRWHASGLRTDARDDGDPVGRLGMTTFSPGPIPHFLTWRQAD